MSRGKHLSEQERFFISNCLKDRMSIRKIAQLLERDAGGVCREIKKGTVMLIDARSGQYIEQYDPIYAQSRYVSARQKCGRKTNISQDISAKSIFEHLIKSRHYSPYAAIKYAEKHELTNQRYSVNTIYSYIRKGILDISTLDLPYGFRVFKKKIPFNKRKKDLPVKGGESIEQRPLTVLNRKEFGHWEGDLILGTRSSKEVILSLVERKTRFALGLKLKNKTTKEVVEAFDKLESLIGEDFPLLFKSITFDNGREFKDALGMKTSNSTGKNRIGAIYYAHPYCSSERGSNENLNRMLRRAFPKKHSFKKVTQKQIIDHVHWINTYPRALLNGYSSYDLFEKEIQRLNIPNFLTA